MNLYTQQQLIEYGKEVLDAFKPGGMVQGDLLEHLLPEALHTGWLLERTERYWHFTGFRYKQYIEVSYWYTPVDNQRKETVRKHCCFADVNKSRPFWTRGVTHHYKHLDRDTNY